MRKLLKISIAIAFVFILAFALTGCDGDGDTFNPGNSSSIPGGGPSNPGGGDQPPPLPALTGSVSINGTAQVGQTLTANTNALGGSGTISYQWRRGENNINGATGSAYIAQSVDAGSTISVTVTRSGNSGSITSAPTGIIVNPGVNQTPVASDFNIGNLSQTVRSVTPVIITPQAGKSTGAITVFYNGSTTLPPIAGTYTVTFNVAASTGWNAANGLAGGTLTILQTVPENRFEFYWVDHGSLVTTGGGAVTINAGSILSIGAQAAGYTVRQWHLNGINTGHSGNAFEFSSTATGRHTIGLFVEKDGRLYNTNITITVQ
jgi:hypothetical protein